MDKAAPRDHRFLRRLHIPGLTRRDPRLFRAASYVRARDLESDSAPTRLMHLWSALKNERTLQLEDFACEIEIPRFIGSTTGRSGTTWLERIFRMSLRDQLETIGERHLFWLHEFQTAPEKLLGNVPGPEFEAFRRTMLGYAFRTRIEEGRITYGGLARLVPKRALVMALDELEDRLAGAEDIAAAYRCLGDFHQWIFNYWTRCVSGRAKPWISKEPSYGVDCDRLFRLVPDARLLVTVRDGRDVALSFVAAGWAPDVLSAMDDWRQATETTLRRLEKLPRDQWLLVRYEDLNARFDETMERILGFYGLAPPGTPVAPRPVSSRVAKWEKELDRAQKSHYERTCGELMERLGYPK